jgi:hypothetical protein
MSACATKPTTPQRTAQDLAVEIQNLGPAIDPAEAQRAAKIAYEYSQILADAYNVTDPALIHNAKVTSGLRERGLCNHWAEDLQKRLNQERFRTLSVRWATSPPTPFKIIHHSAVITPRAGTISDGLILDPWRYGGELFWAKPSEDTQYNWKPRMEVRQQLIKERQRLTAP